MGTPEIPELIYKEIDLGIKFFLFDPENTRDSDRDRKHEGFFSSKVLHSGVIPPFGVDVEATTYYKPIGIEITPFNPDISYQFTEEDFYPDFKDQKCASLEEKQDNPQYLIESQSPLNLVVGLGQTDQEIFRLNAPVEAKRDFFGRLRLQLWFPEETFEAQAYQYNIEDAISNSSSIYFSDFYPTAFKDTLKATLQRENAAKSPKLFGNPLQLPSDEDKLSQIRAIFILAEESDSNIPRKE